MKRTVHVLVVDDSAFMRKIIKDALELDERIVVVATARNGVDALQKLEKHPEVDVVTLDIEMPIKNGLETLQEMMRKKPLPVIMVSSTTTEGATNTIKAFEYGAVDFITKSAETISLDLHKVKAELAAKVISASQIKMKKVLFPSTAKQVLKRTEQTVYLSPLLPKIIAIGTSTGGPKALQEVLTSLPANLPAPIVIVQHMPAGFTKSLAARLNSLSEIEVKEAENNEVLRNGVAYIAPGNYHLTVKKRNQLLISETIQTPARRGHRPSVDVLFESLAKLDNLGKVAVILTGMGSDGAAGLQLLKKSTTCYAIAEAEVSSIVFGMPKAAINTNQVDEIVHLKEIAASIMKQC